MHDIRAVPHARAVRCSDGCVTFGGLKAFPRTWSDGYTGEGANWNKEAESTRQLECLCFIIRPVTAVGVQLKAANSDVLILDRKEDKDN